MRRRRGRQTGAQHCIISLWVFAGGLRCLRHGILNFIAVTWPLFAGVGRCEYDKHDLRRRQRRTPAAVAAEAASRALRHIMLASMVVPNGPITNAKWTFLKFDSIREARKSRLDLQKVTQTYYKPATTTKWSKSMSTIVV